MGNRGSLLMVCMAMLTCTAVLLTETIAQAVDEQQGEPRSIQNEAGPAAAANAFVLELDVLTQPQPAYRLNAQKWGRVFQELGYVARIRDGRTGERSQIEDVDRGGTRTARIVMIMDADGSLTVRAHRFQMTQPRPLVEFLQQIKTWGASGPPSASPTWGLTDEQFAGVTELLSHPVTEAIAMNTAIEAIDSLRLPNAFRVRFTDAARQMVFQPPAGFAAAEQDLTGISQGTALAIALSQFGLGFRTLQNAEVEGRYVIEVDAGNESTNLWPVGWKTKEPMGTILPTLYKPIPVEVEEVEVDSLIAVIAEKLQIPAYYSSFPLQAAGLQPAHLHYTRKLDQISPSRLLMLLGDRFRLGLDIRADESGTCFLWVTTQAEYQAFRRRFAHVVPGVR